MAKKHKKYIIWYVPDGGTWSLFAETDKEDEIARLYIEAASMANCIDNVIVTEYREVMITIRNDNDNWR